MTFITNVSLWKDIGYLEDSVTAPKRNSQLPEASLSIPDRLAPSVSDLFSTLTIPYEYAGLMDMSYIQLTIEWNNADPQIFYGWIDSIESKSDTEDYPSTIIRWHVDLWRTYINTASIGYGEVLRRPKSTNDPIQNCPYRYHVLSEGFDDLIPRNVIGATEYWGLINCAIETDNNTKVETYTIVTPLSSERPIYFKAGQNSEVKQAPTMEDWILGRYDEMFGLAPSQIASAYVTPLPPISLKSGTGTANDPYVLTTSGTTPVPHTETKQGTFDDGRTIIGWAGNAIVWQNGERRDYPECMSGLYTVNYATGGWPYFGGRVIGPNGLIYATPAGDGNFLTVIPIDVLIQQTFGSNVFNELNDGDSISISGMNSIWQNMSLDIVYDNIAYATYTVSGEVSSNTFTYSNGTFGQYYVFCIGTPRSLSISLTTTAIVESIDDFGVKGGLGSYTQYGYFYRYDNKFTEYEMHLPAPSKSTETEQLIVTDMNAIPVASIPFGFEIQDYTIRNVVSTNSAYIQIRFDGLRSAAEGLEVTIPLPSVPIASNSYSEYNFSALRDYDIQQRKIANEQTLYEGLFGFATSKSLLGGLGQGGTTSTTTTERYARSTAKGSRMKMVGRTIATTATAGALGGPVGLAISAGVGVGSAIGQYALDRLYSERLQGVEDMLQARQIDAIITPAEGWDWHYHGQRIRLTSIKPDNYSIQRFEESIRLNGIECDEPTSDCDSLLDAGGPLKIRDAIVGGNIPVEAKTYISMRLSMGVRIV